MGGISSSRSGRMGGETGWEIADGLCMMEEVFKRCQGWSDLGNSLGCFERVEKNRMLQLSHAIVRGGSVCLFLYLLLFFFYETGKPVFSLTNRIFSFVAFFVSRKIMILKQESRSLRKRKTAFWKRN